MPDLVLFDVVFHWLQLRADYQNTSTSSHHYGLKTEKTFKKQRAEGFSTSLAFITVSKECWKREKHVARERHKMIRVLLAFLKLVVVSMSLQQMTGGWLSTPCKASWLTSLKHSLTSPPINPTVSNKRSRRWSRRQRCERWMEKNTKILIVFPHFLCKETRRQLYTRIGACMIFLSTLISLCGWILNLTYKLHTEVHACIGREVKWVWEH